MTVDKVNSTIQRQEAELMVKYLMNITIQDYFFSVTK